MDTKLLEKSPALKFLEAPSLCTSQGQYPQFDWEHADFSRPTKNKSKEEKLRMSVHIHGLLDC